MEFVDNVVQLVKYVQEILIQIVANVMQDIIYKVELIVLAHVFLEHIRIIIQWNAFDTHIFLLQ